MANKGEVLKQRAYSEFKEFLMLTIYLWLFLGMFILYKSVVLAENHIDFAAHGVALINALVLAKFMLIVRAFHPAKQTEDAPLIYPTLVKAGIFAVTLMVLKILEDITVGYFHHRSFTESIADLGGGSWRAILIFTVILFLVLIPLTAFGEVQRVLGEGKLQGLFLRPRDLSGSK
jgi:hypothetical protein